MSRPLVAILKTPFLPELQTFFKKKKVPAYIVGGLIRDILLKRKKSSLDIDLAVQKNAIKLAREFAHTLHAGFVVLDAEHGAARVVKKHDGGMITFDFTDFRGKTLVEDVRHRDFTVNALAVDVLIPDILIDHCGGVDDLHGKVIRALGKNTFAEDPLRIMRAFSFASILGFRIDKETKAKAARQKKLLQKVSSERVRDELFKVLQQPNAYACLKELDTLGILSVILPEIEAGRGVNQGPYHHLDIWAHSLETVRQLDAVINNFKNKEQYAAYFNQELSIGRPRVSLIRFGALLHDIGKPKALRKRDGKLYFHGHERIGRGMVRDICVRLKLSNDEREAVERMVFFHLRPGFLADVAPVTPRAKFRYFRDTQQDAVSVLLISLADQRSTHGVLTDKESHQKHEDLVAVLLRDYCKAQSQKKPERLVNGNDVMKAFALPPSPLIGKILREIEELQATGEVTTKKEALEEVKNMIKRRTRKT